MKFRTEIFIPQPDFSISHQDNILLMGSCFAENIGNKLQSSGFQVDINPFGVLYNPLSVASGVQNLLQQKQFSAADVFEYKGMFSSLSHHSRFSAPTQAACLEKINNAMTSSAAFLERTTVLMVTFGTSYIYQLKETGTLVSNCHKLPPDRFSRERLSVKEIVDTWSALAETLKKNYPSLKILMTVSPVRHWKDGAHENQLSKSILLLAIEALQQQHDYIRYFPSYELIMDDLRDYRFYADDLLHPAAAAIDYIWEKFSTAYFNQETTARLKEYNHILQDLAHRPFNPESDEYKAFKSNAEKKLKAFHTS